MNSAVAHISRISRLFARFGGLLILLCAVLVSLDVIFRNAFKVTFFESFELTGYAVAMAITFGLAWSMVSKAHIRIEVIYATLGIRMRGWLDLAALGVMALFSIVLTYWSAIVVIDNFNMGARSNTSMAMPLAWPQGLWLLGLAWFSICSIVLFGVALRGVSTRRFDEVQALFGVASIEEEVERSIELGPGQASPAPLSRNPD